jgi:hypothetical protein
MVTRKYFGLADNPSPMFEPKAWDSDEDVSALVLI